MLGIAAEHDRRQAVAQQLLQSGRPGIDTGGAAKQAAHPAGEVAEQLLPNRCRSMNVFSGVVTDFGQLGGRGDRLRQAAKFIDQADRLGLTAGKDPSFSDGINFFL